MSKELIRRLLILLTVAAASYAFALACSDDDLDKGPDAGDPTTNNPANNPTNNPVNNPANNAANSDTGPPPSYLYVRLVDANGSTNDMTEHVGADIDAVILNGETAADEIISAANDVPYQEGITNGISDPVCSQGQFASLGAGAGIIVGFSGTAIQSGDTIEVIEVGSDVCSPSGPDEDAYRVFLGETSDDVSYELGTCTEGSECSFTVP